MSLVTQETKNLVYRFILIELAILILDKKDREQEALSLRRESRNLKNCLKQKQITIMLSKNNDGYVTYRYFVKDEGEGQFTFWLEGLKQTLREIMVENRQQLKERN